MCNRARHVTGELDGAEQKNTPQHPDPQFGGDRFVLHVCFKHARHVGSHIECIEHSGPGPRWRRRGSRRRWWSRLWRRRFPRWRFPRWWLSWRRFPRPRIRFWFLSRLLQWLLPLLRRRGWLLSGSPAHQDAPWLADTPRRGLRVIPVPDTQYLKTNISRLPSQNIHLKIARPQRLSLRPLLWVRLARRNGQGLQRLPVAVGAG